MTDVLTHRVLPGLTEAKPDHHHDLHRLEWLKLQPYCFKVITAFEAAKVWSLNPPVDGIPYHVRYNTNTVLTCARENTKRIADWRMVWLYGLSLRELKRHSHSCGEVRFDRTYSWWDHENEHAWSGAKFEAGYYLVDVSGRFRKKTWHQQEELIGGYGRGYMRASEAMIAETAFLTARHTQESGGARELLLPDFMHRGPSHDSTGDGICVGSFHPTKGMKIINAPRDAHGGDSDGVCLIKRFDH